MNTLETHKLGMAMFSHSFPCNPRPFVLGLLTYINNGGNITDRPAKRILFTITGILEKQLFLLQTKELLKRISHNSPRQPLDVLQEMEALSKKNNFSPEEDWKPLLPHLILASCKEEVYDSFLEYQTLHPLKDTSNVTVVYHQIQNGERIHLHSWETSLPKTQEEIHEAVTVTGLSEPNSSISYQVIDENDLILFEKELPK